MAISKTQNERPAIIELVDAVNTTESTVAQNVLDIATLTEGLADEVIAREGGDSALTESLGLTNTKVLALQGFVNRFRIGLTQQFTVAPNDSHTETITFNTPFDSDAQVLVLPNCVDSEAAFGTLECQLIDANNIGFNFGVYNSDSDNSYTISVGFVAVQVN